MYEKGWVSRERLREPYLVSMRVRLSDILQENYRLFLTMTATEFCEKKIRNGPWGFRKELELIDISISRHP